MQLLPFQDVCINKVNKWFQINTDKMYECCPGHFRLFSSVSITSSIAYTQLSACNPWLLALASCTALLLALARCQLMARLCCLWYHASNRFQGPLNNPPTKLFVVTICCRSFKAQCPNAESKKLETFSIRWDVSIQYHSLLHTVLTSQITKYHSNLFNSYLSFLPLGLDSPDKLG